jgi:hypothetical protein
VTEFVESDEDCDLMYEPINNEDALEKSFKVQENLNLPERVLVGAEEAFSSHRAGTWSPSSRSGAHRHSFFQKA